MIPFPVHASEWEGKIIHQITFDPTATFSDVDLFEIIDIHPGSRYRQHEIRAGIQRLYETGKFKDIWVEAEPAGEGKISLRFVLIQRRIFSSVRVVGNYFVSQKEILEAMKIRPEDEFTENRWEKAVSEVVSLYNKKGFLKARFSSQFRPHPENRRRIEAFLHVDEGAETKIRRIIFRGNKVFSDLALILKMDSEKGQHYRFDYLERDLQRLREYYDEEGYFKAIIGPPVISFVEETNEVDIVLPIESLNRIVFFFEGRGPFSVSRLAEKLIVKEERSDADDVLEESARRIETFYRQKGYPFAKVSVRAKRLPEENRTEAYFKIDRGFRVLIEEIRFAGNHAFPENRLKEILRTQEGGGIKKALYTREFIEEDITRLLLFYKKEGFQKVDIASDVQFDPLGKTAVILFKIDEGVRTRVEQIQIEGSRALSEEKLKEAILPRVQSPYNDVIVQEGARQLLSAYAREGYIYTEVESSVHFTEDQTGVAVTYHLDEGPQIHLGRIELDGNLRTKDYVLLREMVIKEGDPYNIQNILKSQQRLYRTGHFSVVRFDPIAPEERPLVQDVRLSVIERPGVALEFGFGYADRDRFRGFVEASHHNLWGTGRSISSRIQVGHVDERYIVNYKEPLLLGRDLDGRVGAAYIRTDDPSFDVETLSGTIGVDKSFSETVKGSFLYQYELNNTTNVDINALLITEDIGKLAIGSLNPSIVRDTRNDPFNPRSGSINGIKIRNAALFLASEVQFVKVTLQSVWYQALSSKVVFAFSARAGAAERYGETRGVPISRDQDGELVPISERFFLGGRSTLRGYDQDSVGVKDETLINGVATGGNAMLIFNEELRIALPKSLGLVLFLDHGNVWRNYKDIELSQIKSTTGLGLRYNTPIGPFRLDWGYKLNREAEESPWEFHFTLGHAF